MNNQEKRKVLKRTIYLCWGALLLCFIIKLLGGNYFEIFATNETFINVCNWIDGNIVKYLIRFIFANISFYLYTSAVIGKDISVKKFAIIEIFIIADVIVKYIFPSLGFILDCIMLVGIPLLLSKSIKRTILGFALINVFQIFSLLTRNIGMSVLNTNSLIEYILQVDYYIMLILYYLYSVKLKGEKK